MRKDRTGSQEDGLPAEAEDSGYADVDGFLGAMQRLKVRRDRNRDLAIGIGCGVLGLVIGLVIGHTTAGSGGNTPSAASPVSAASRGALPDPLAQDSGSTDPALIPLAPGTSATSGATDAGVITFSVTGKASGGVLITYGTNSTGSQSSKLPFSASIPLDSSGGVLYYDVYAQLRGSGDLTCSVAVNGEVIKTGTATTDADICSAQIAQDPGTGRWQSE